MSFLKEEIEKRKIPDLLVKNSGERVKNKADFEKRKLEIKSLLAEHIYGEMPESPSDLSVEMTEERAFYMGGKGIFRRFLFTATVYGENFSFPVTSVIPTTQTPPPVFLYISFDSDFPGDHSHLPIEEIIDGGFAVFTFGYKDITSDNGDFDNGIAKIFRAKMDSKNAPGKIAMWAWAAMRVMDYIITLDYVDTENVAIIGHSRLGKTALVTGASDERFKYVISNDSGCSGAAITRGKVGEQISNITEAFSYWFTDKYKEYVGDGIKKMPLDQNFLTALIPPRHLIIGSAILDEWADPKSEFLNAVMTNEVYGLYGLRGLIHEDKYPEPKSILSEGECCYQVRHGGHYLSREDWSSYMKYIREKM